MTSSDAAADARDLRTRRPGESARARDERAWSAAKPPLTRYLTQAVVRSGRSPLALAREYLRLSRGRGRLTLPEYVQYGVYDASMGADDKSRFISEALHWPMVRRCNDVTFEAATEDKWLCTELLQRAGIPAPALLAVVDTAGRTFPGTRTVRSARDLRDLVMSHCGGGSTLFFKPNRGLASFGAFVVTAAEADRLHIAGEGWMSHDACLGELIGGEPYVVQRTLANGPSLRRYADALATVRVYMLRADDRVVLPFAALKVPAPGEVADNHWRPGSLACDVDPATGRIATARSKDEFGTTAHAVHPDTGAALVGETLPSWDRIKDLARECSGVFAPTRYASVDVAVLADGPAIVEVNTGGAFNIPQLTRGRGFLTDEVLDFFRSCGYRG